MPVLSTGLVNHLMGFGSMRSAFADCSMKIYSGTMPVTADEAPGNTLLCTLTRASATTTLRNGWGELNKVLVTSHAAAQIWAFDVTIDTETLITTRSYVNTPDAGDVYDVAVRLVKLFQDVGLFACCTGTDGYIYVIAPSCCSLLIALNAGSTGTVTISDAIYAKDSNDQVRFAAPTAGVLPKNTVVDVTWSGVNAATGVAGFFRIVTPDDTGILSTSNLRYQGTIATSGSDLNMSNTTLTISATTTLDTFTLTLPKSA